MDLHQPLGYRYRAPERPLRMAGPERPYPLDRALTRLLTDTRALNWGGLRAMQDLSPDTIFGSLYITRDVGKEEHPMAAGVMFGDPDVWCMRLQLSTHDRRQPYRLFVYSPDVVIAREERDDPDDPGPQWVRQEQFTAQRPFQFTCSRTWINQWISSVAFWYRTKEELLGLAELLDWLEEIPHASQICRIYLHIKDHLDNDPAATIVSSRSCSCE
ncbi:hypothetical protein OBBRIDRAFT_829794, partial [Obba rivulosa]